MEIQIAVTDKGYALTVVDAPDEMAVSTELWTQWQMGDTPQYEGGPVVIEQEPLTVKFGREGHGVGIVTYQRTNRVDSDGYAIFVKCVDNDKQTMGQDDMP